MSAAQKSKAEIDAQRSAKDDVLKDLLRSIGIGDRAAFKALYEATSAPCFSILLRMLNNADDAEEVLQKAYVSIWKNAGKYDSKKGKAFTWIVVIMKNRAIDVLRARARAPQTELIEEQLVDLSQNAASRAESFMISRYLQEGFSKLPENVATAVRMNIIEGYSSTEIGEQMNVSRNTVKTWIRRGLITLRRDLPFKSYQAAL